MTTRLWIQSLMTHRYAVACGLVLLGCTLEAFHHLDTPPLWNDEALSFFVAADGMATALTRIASDTNGPLYYLVLSA